MKIFMFILRNQKGDLIQNAFQVPKELTFIGMLKATYPGWYLVSYSDITDFVFQSHISLIAEMLDGRDDLEIWKEQL